MSAADDGFEALKARYLAYVDTFRGPDGRLGEMLELKLAHTMRVVDNATRIADGEGFDSERRSATIAAALLHDTGRYEQLVKYDTFNDADSIDHAALSHDIVARLGWVVGRPDAEAVLAAVLYHNRKEVPEGLDPLTEAASHAVRDADKLDIFRVLEERVATTDWRRDAKAFWNLKAGLPPSPAVVAAIRGGRSVDYSEIRTLSDFVLIQVGWMICGLHYRVSRRLCAERGHLAFRRRFLDEIGGGAEAEELCDRAERLALSV